MRPLELRLAGFRSYRSERTVSFRDIDLVAIIGDTGAGKSSLLEAMTWALYGAATWSRKASAELLAHGARRMSVALEFEAAGERWLVTRSFARSGGGSAELACLSDPTIARRWTACARSTRRSSACSASPTRSSAPACCSRRAASSACSRRRRARRPTR